MGKQYNEHYLKKELYDLVKSDSTLFDFIQEGSLDGMWYWNLENFEDEWLSPRFWEVLGYDPKKKKHKASEWQDIIFKEDLKEATDNFEKHLQDPKHPYDQIVRYKHKDGSTVWIRCRGIAIRDASGKATRMLGAHMNITDLKQKEAALIELEKEHLRPELIIANQELAYQNEEKGKRAAELVIANKELIFQNEEMEKKVEELLLAKEQIEIARVKIDQSWRYNQSLIEASTDPIMTIDQDGIIINVNSAVETATGLLKKNLLSTDFSELFTEPEKAKGYYQKVFEKGKAFNYELNLKHIKGFTTPVIYNAFVYSDNEKKRVGLLVASDDIKTKQKDEIVYLQINLHLLIEQKTRELMETNKKLAIENEKNEYLGNHDYSTNLYNRRYFVNAFDAFTKKGCFPQGLTMIDINGLKIINDAYGHVKGDDAIKQVANLLLRVFDHDDVVARIGGDEFAILSPNKNASQMQDYKDKLVLLSEDIKIENIPVSLAIGYEILSDNDKDFDELLSKAEKQLYRHKITVGER